MKNGFREQDISRKLCNLVAGGEIADTSVSSAAGAFILFHHFFCCVSMGYGISGVHGFLFLKEDSVGLRS